MYAGAVNGSVAGLALKRFGVVKVFFSGGLSYISINGGVPFVGNAGTTSPGGLTLASLFLHNAAFANVQFKEIIVRKVADDTTKQTIIYNYLADKLIVINLIGDSITQGSGATTESSKYKNIVADARGCSMVADGVPSRAMAVNGVVDGWITIMDQSTPVKTKPLDKLVFLLGTNDSYYNVDLVVFKTAYISAINKAKEKGWNNADIRICTIPFATSELYQNITGYNTKITEIGNELGISVVDVYGTMVANGGATLLSGDGVHPNDAGHLVIANTIALSF